MPIIELAQGPSLIRLAIKITVEHLPEPKESSFSDCAPTSVQLALGIDPKALIFSLDLPSSYLVLSAMVNPQPISSHVHDTIPRPDPTTHPRTPFNQIFNFTFHIQPRSRQKLTESYTGRPLRSGRCSHMQALQTQLQATVPNGRRPLQNLHRADAGGSRLAWAIGASQINSHGVRGLIALYRKTITQILQSNSLSLSHQSWLCKSHQSQVGGQDARYKSPARCFPFLHPIDKKETFPYRDPTEKPNLTLSMNVHDLDTCEF